MINDENAELLEAKGLYRRAATRWMEVMHSCEDDLQREWVKRRCDACLAKTSRSPAKLDMFADLRKAVDATQQRLGIVSPDSDAYRLQTRCKKSDQKHNY